MQRAVPCEPQGAAPVPCEPQGLLVNAMIFRTMLMNPYPIVTCFHIESTAKRKGIDGTQKDEYFSYFCLFVYNSKSCAAVHPWLVSTIFILEETIIIYEQ